MLFYVTTVLVAIATALYLICTRNFNYWKKRNVLGPEPIPFFGNIKDNVLRRKHIGVVMEDIYEQFKHEKLVGIYRMNTPWLLVNDLDLVKDVLIKNFDAFVSRGIEFRKEEFGENIFHASEETWRLLRHQFSPMFTSGKLKNMFHLLDERSDIYLYVQNFFHDLVKNILIQRNGKPSGRKDFMVLILELSQCEEAKSKDEKSQTGAIITQDVIATQAFIFYAGGYETSATTMTFMLHQLAIDQGIQEKVKAEIDDVLQRYDGKITYESVSEMKYIYQVLDETLRMYPILEVLHRVANKDYKLPGTDATIEKGQRIMIPVTGIHHDERYYPNPEVFDPERFSTENIRNRHTCAYQAFGAGPRNCMGIRFGKLQAILGIVKLLLKFRLEPSTKTQKSLQIDPKRIVYSPLGEVNINFVQRH